MDFDEEESDRNTKDPATTHVTEAAILEESADPRDSFTRQVNVDAIADSNTTSHPSAESLLDAIQQGPELEGDDSGTTYRGPVGDAQKVATSDAEEGEVAVGGEGAFELGDDEDIEGRERALIETGNDQDESLEGALDSTELRRKYQGDEESPRTVKEQPERKWSRRGSFRATSCRKVPTLTEAELEAYTREVAVERTASGFYGEDGYYYYYVYQDDSNVQTTEGESIVAEVETTERRPRDWTRNRFVVGAGSGKLNGYISLPASHSAQESESYLARIRDWVNVDSLDGPMTSSEDFGLAPDEASMELKGAGIVDAVKAKAILQYLRSDTDRWVRPPIDTVEGALVANLRIPTYNELRQRLKYEDLRVGALQTQPSLSQEWNRIQNEVQMSMASQAERARRASLSQRRVNDTRRSQSIMESQGGGRRMSSLLFLIPPRG